MARTSSSVVLLLFLLLLVLACTAVGGGRDRRHPKGRRRTVHTSRCSYTLVVQEQDSDSACPKMTSNDQDDLQRDDSKASFLLSQPSSDTTLKDSPSSSSSSPSSSSSSSSFLDPRFFQNEQRIFGEFLRYHELNKTLGRHDMALNKYEHKVKEFENSFKKVFRTMMYIEKKLQQQRSMSQSLNHKISNVILDVVEVNNVLTKRVPTQDGTMADKGIEVASVAQTRGCPGLSPGAVVYKDCQEVLDEGHWRSGVYYIKPSCSACPIPVWCDMETPPGGWLLLQRRQDGRVSFDRSWEEYKNGFGDVTGEHWLGNDNIFLLSNQDTYQLRVDLWDFKGNRVYSTYDTFKVEGERDKYRLHVHGFGGSGGDSLYEHNRMMFSTLDSDNDGRHESNCAKQWEGGWWFNNCWYAFLNGPYYNSSEVKWRGIGWNHWKREQLHKTEMKIRPLNK